MVRVKGKVINENLLYKNVFTWITCSLFVLEMLCDTEILCVHIILFLPLSLSDRCAKSSQIKTVSSSNIFFKGSRFRYR